MRGLRHETGQPLRADRRSDGAGSGDIGGGGLGFSLVEMVVALAVTGILASAVVAVVLHQSEFYATSDSAVRSEENIQAVSALVASELRMASDEDLITTEPDRVELRLDLMRAVVCQVTGTSVTLYVFDRAASASAPGPPDAALYRNPPYTGSFQAGPSWNPASWQTDADVGGGTYASRCASAGAPSGDDPSRYGQYSGWNPPPDPGAVVRVYGTLVYRFAPSDFTDGLALWRNDGELAAPFAEGAEFRYPTSGGSVEAVVVSARSLGDVDGRHSVERDFELAVPLRN